MTLLQNRNVGSCGILLVCCYALMSCCASAFTTSPSLLSAASHITGAHSSRLSASSVDSDAKVYPPLSREEIESVIADIPVFAISSSKNDGGIVMLSEKDNDNAIAYFFFNPNTANAMFQPLKATVKQPDDEWSVTQFPLSLIYFELMKFDKETGRAIKNGIEYRLKADTENLQGARQVLTEVAKQQGLSEKDDVPDTFLATYNDIPVFLDPRMRLQMNPNEGEDNDDEENLVEQFPMYLSLEDLVTTFQTMTSLGSEEQQKEQPMVSVSNLKDLIEQMQTESTVDFRKTRIYKPSNTQQQQMPLFGGGDTSGDKPVDLGSTMTGGWDDDDDE